MEILSWSIFGTVMVLAIGVAYNSALKTAESAHSLKLANEEVARLRKQVETLQEEINNLTLKARKSELGVSKKDHKELLDERKLIDTLNEENAQNQNIF